MVILVAIVGYLVAAAALALVVGRSIHRADVEHASIHRIPPEALPLR